MKRIECSVPDGARGAWRVESFEVSCDDAERYNVGLHRWGVARIAPGHYKRLLHGQTVVMSNTPLEIRTHQCFIGRASGDVLINGLGLGMVVTALLENPNVTSITVVEIEGDVIDLVAPSFTDARVHVHHADAFEFTPERGRRFDAVWHDIWPSISADNLQDMHRLHRRYARRCQWQDSWARAECELLHEEWMRSPYNPIAMRQNSRIHSISCQRQDA